MRETPNSLVGPQQARLPRSIWLLSWISFFADISSEMIYPLLPLFMVVILGASKTQLGLMEGFSVLLVALLAAWAGWRSDRARERVPWMRWGYGLPVVGKALIAIATVWPMAMAGRWFDRLGKGLRGAPRDALIVDAVDPAQLGRAFGLHRAMDTAGAMAGVLLAAGLLWWLSADLRVAGRIEVVNVDRPVPGWIYRAVIGVGAAMGLASWLLTFWLRESGETANKQAEPSQGSKTDVAPSDHEPDGAGGWWGLPKRYWGVLLALGLFGLADSSDAFLLLRAAELGFKPWAVVLIYAAYNASYALLSYPAGSLSDRIGRWPVIAWGWGLYAVVYFGMVCLTPNMAWTVWPLMGLYGVYMALSEGVGKALIGEHLPPQHRGRGMGIFHATIGISGLLASIVTGWLWDRFGGSWALLPGAILAILAVAVVIVMGVVGRVGTTR